MLVSDTSFNRWRILVTKIAHSVTNIVPLSQTFTISNIRHQHLFSRNKLVFSLNVFKLSFLSPFVRESLTNHIHAEVHKVFMYQAIESVVIGYCVVMQLVTYTTFQLFVGMPTT